MAIEPFYLWSIKIIIQLSLDFYKTIFRKYMILFYSRYPFYFLQTIGYCPRWLLWLRYTAWIPLYPLGIITEGKLQKSYSCFNIFHILTHFSVISGILIYQAASLFDATNRWSLSLNFIADISIPFSFFLRLYLIILAIGKWVARTVWQYKQSQFLSAWEYGYECFPL